MAAAHDRCRECRYFRAWPARGIAPGCGVRSLGQSRDPDVIGASSHPRQQCSNLTPLTLPTPAQLALRRSVIRRAGNVIDAKPVLASVDVVGAVERSPMCGPRSWVVTDRDSSAGALARHPLAGRRTDPQLAAVTTTEAAHSELSSLC